MVLIYLLKGKEVLAQHVFVNVPQEYFHQSHMEAIVALAVLEAHEYLNDVGVLNWGEVHLMFVDPLMFQGLLARHSFILVGLNQGFNELDSLS